MDWDLMDIERYNCKNEMREAKGKWKIGMSFWDKQKFFIIIIICLRQRVKISREKNNFNGSNILFILLCGL
jgi:hypothetical protein